jgi:hypothetical protein
VEKARQHSAVGSEHFALGAVYIAGLLAIPTGLALQFAIGGRSLHISLLIFVASRVVISFWRAVRPGVFTKQKSSPKLWTLAGVLWMAFGIAISMPFWGIQ